MLSLVWGRVYTSMQNDASTRGDASVPTPHPHPARPYAGRNVLTASSWLTSGYQVSNNHADCAGTWAGATQASPPNPTPHPPLRGWERNIGGPPSESVDFWMEDEGVHMQVALVHRNEFFFIFICYIS